jgi:hypothetical protein
MNEDNIREQIAQQIEAIDSIPSNGLGMKILAAAVARGNNEKEQRQTFTKQSKKSTQE